MAPMMHAMTGVQPWTATEFGLRLAMWAVMMIAMMVPTAAPMTLLYAAVARKLKDGTVFYPKQRMSRMEALRSYTISAAYAGFEEQIKGSLKAGKLADVTVLSKDIMTIPEGEIPSTEVLYTIVGGQVHYKKGAGTPMTPAPSLRTFAGARLMVMLLAGYPKPELIKADLIRSRLSLTALSGNPTVLKSRTSLEYISTSTSIRCASMP